MSPAGQPSRSELIGAEDLRKKLVKLGDDADKTMGEGLARGGAVVQGSAKVHILHNPHTLASGETKEGLVDTGNLLNSVQVSKPQGHGRGLFVDVGTGVEYGLYHEMGTSTMEAHPWLIPAFDESIEGAKRAIAVPLVQRIDELERKGR